MKKERLLIETSKLLLNEGQLDWLPRNPRTWTRQDLDKLKASIESDPDFLEDRPALIVPYKKDKFIVFGGNMRTAANQELNRPTMPAMKYIPETDEDRETIKRRALLDNGSFGAWDFDALANEWDDLPLTDWGVPACNMGKDGLPDELAGVDMTPDPLENMDGVGGDGKRIVIAYKEEQEEELLALLGLGSFDKVVYDLDELPFYTPDEQS